jgi:hypothetical protein
MKMNKNKIAKIKNVASKISFPEKNKIENAKSILNLQIGKIILQIKRE